VLPRAGGVLETRLRKLALGVWRSAHQSEAGKIERAGSIAAPGPCHFNKEQTPLASLRYQPAVSRRMFRCLPFDTRGPGLLTCRCAQPRACPEFAEGCLGHTSPEALKL